MVVVVDLSDILGVDSKTSKPYDDCNGTRADYEYGIYDHNPSIAYVLCGT